MSDVWDELDGRIIMDPMRPSVGCSHPGCHGIVDLSIELVYQYLQDNAVRCPSCGHEFSLWTAIRLSIERELTPLVYGLSGASTMGLGYVLESEKRYWIDLNAAGLPKDVRIVSRQYSEGKGFRVVEATGSQPGGWSFPTQYGLITIPHLEASSETADVMVAVTFIDESILSNAAGRQFFLACDLFLRHEDYGLVAVVAHSAIELAVEQTIARYAAQAVVSKRAFRFAEGLQEAAAVNVLAPVLAANLGVPAMKSHMQGSLDALRKARNGSAHGGEPVPRSDVVNGLATVFFHLAWLGFIASRLPSPRS
ncbi:MAG: hypothetical protein ABSB09_11950 [Acidimicrobiales bacterium]|jgi:hypothetical protein